MTKTITTYQDLIEEKERLTLQLRYQKDLVRQDFNEIKEAFKPIQETISTVGRFATKDKKNWLLTGAADMIIDIVLKKVILGRAGWLTKLAVPLLAKNYSSHVIADNKGKILSSLFSFFSKKHENGKHVEEEEEEED